METSNYISLGALFVSIVALIPQYHLVFSKRKIEHQKSENEQRNESSATEETYEIEKNIESKEPNESKEPMPFMLKILMLVVFAVASFLVEIILFSMIAYFCGVEVSLDTMTLLWKVIFYALFFIPGVFLFLAFLTFVANTTD